MFPEIRPYVRTFSLQNPRMYLPLDYTFFVVNTQTVFIGCTHTYHIHEHQKYMNFYLKNIRTIRVIVMNIHSG